MDEDGEKRVRAKKSGEVDWISNLPDPLIFQVLLNLPTKIVVKTSVLSHRWRNLWKYVPGLDLTYEDFSEYYGFVSIVDSFLGLNSESHLQRFKLSYGSKWYGEFEIALIRRWINTVINRKVQYLHLSGDSYGIKIPLSVYTCESLVCLELSSVTLVSPKFVSLPLLKDINLSIVRFSDNLVLETLISRCPVLERLTIEKSFCDDYGVLRVRSQSLLKFTHIADTSAKLVEDLVIDIDAPRLKYLRISDGRTASIIRNNDTASLVEADIDTVFNLGYGKKFDPNDLEKMNMIRNFLCEISNVKDMTITSSTLEILYDYSRCELLPFFCNLSVLRVNFCDYNWEMLPIFLESCPNLKSLIVGSTRYLARKRDTIYFGPQEFLSSLEYVKIERPWKGEAMEMQLVSYLLENSTNLKKLTLTLDGSMKKKESVVLKELLTISRVSSCQVVVL